MNVLQLVSGCPGYNCSLDDVWHISNAKEMDGGVICKGAALIFKRQLLSLLSDRCEWHEWITAKVIAKHAL